MVLRDRSLFKLSKTAVFFDLRMQLHEANSTVQTLLQGLGYPTSDDAEEACEIYHARISQFDKERIYSAFQENRGRVRLMYYTDAVGMDVDMPDICCGIW